MADFQSNNKILLYGKTLPGHSIFRIILENKFFALFLAFFIFNIVGNIS